MSDDFTENDRHRPKTSEVQVDEGLILRKFRPEDVDAYYDLLDRNREHLTKHGDYSEAKTATHIDVALELSMKTTEQRFGIWEGNDLVGRLDIIPYEEGNVGVGYWLDESSQGRGIMSRSLVAAINYARNELGAHTMWAGVTKGNDQSKDLLLAQGFTLAENLNHYERFKLDL